LLIVFLENACMNSLKEQRTRGQRTENERTVNRRTKNSVYSREIHLMYCSGLPGSGFSQSFGVDFLLSRGLCTGDQNAAEGDVTQQYSDTKRRGVTNSDTRTSTDGTPAVDDCDKINFFYC